VLVHLLLFRPQPGLTADERKRLADALSLAIREIPSVRRARVGRRVTHGRPYEQMMRNDYTHVAMIEFDDVAGLKAYLAHPAHEQLGARFFDSFEEALIYDYEVADGEDGIRAITSAD
jgi:hypothetical protein